METTANLKQNITEIFKELDEKLSSFSESQINKKPFEGSWTAGQLAQHLILGCSGLSKLCDGKTEKTDRDPSEKIDVIKSVFLNFDTKMQSPEFLYTEDKEYNQILLLLALQKIEQELLHISNNYDLTLTCLDFVIPSFGKLTIYEWIYFDLIHIQRHLKQLNTIFEKVTQH
ncbi:DinB family protein [Flavobacterium sp. 5]|uniref:DinB family protein n=1 Tax=Flavobacterium sp. 5 TaxID=2035199 RepID=UPI000C2C3FE6|nr:DinB family protein [Flavobacterium sp. 5]PKB15190.1 DinB family protein [Flavobacterium sp. 5]